MIKHLGSYYVYNRKRDKPVVSHKDYESAKAEMTRLMLLCPEEEFQILQIIETGICHVKKTIETHKNEELPY